MDLLLIDNSNVFVGLSKRFEGENARFDYQKFTKISLENNSTRKVIIGSTPPARDSFWTTMKNNGFETITYNRTFHGEKRVDGEVITQGVSHIYESDPGTLILVSGDLDMRPLIDKAYEKKWKVIIWSWKDSLNNEYLHGDIRHEIDGVYYLDDKEDDLIFFQTDQDSREYWSERKIRMQREKEELSQKQIQPQLDNIEAQHETLSIQDREEHKNFAGEVRTHALRNGVICFVGSVTSFGVGVLIGKLTNR